ncbi:unnamed protein product [Rhizophagus irregularis]|nr:unnamed protein product [Rhizophagus irregularis]
MEGQQPNQQQEVSKKIYVFVSTLVKAIQLIGSLISFISLLIYLIRINDEITAINKDIRKSMNSGFEEIAKMNKMFECQLNLVNKEISVMNKIYEGEIGLIEGKLNLINKINKEIKLFDGKHVLI